MKKRVLSLLMALALCFTMLPAAAFAETVDAAAAEVQTGGKTADAHLAKEDATKDGGALQAAQTLIDTLPENAAKIEAQLRAIDEAMDALTAEEADALDMERYLSVCAALAAMTEVQAGHEHPICGDVSCNKHGASLTGWVGVSELSDDMEAGYYYLTGPVTRRIVIMIVPFA